MSDASPRPGQAGVFEALAAVGFERPPQLTVAAYLEALIETGVVQAATARAFQREYHAATYGAGRDGDAVERRGRGLVEEARACDAESAARAVARLAAVRAEGVERAARVEALVAAPVEERVGEEIGAASQEPAGVLEVVEDATSSLPRPRWRLRLAVAGWSLVMIVVGWSAHGVAERHGGAIQARLTGQAPRRSASQMLERYRAFAGQRPDSERAWRRYANHARHHRFYADALVGLRHLVARAPDDAGLHNELAWLFCSAEPAWVRDPVQALALAERAYQLHPAHNVVDTLATAAYLNGDFARAIQLERLALDQEPNNRFYQRQLEKFQAAASASAQ